MAYIKSNTEIFFCAPLNTLFRVVLYNNIVYLLVLCNYNYFYILLLYHNTLEELSGFNILVNLPVFCNAVVAAGY